MMSKPTTRIALVDGGRKPKVIENMLPLIEEQYDLELTTDRDADYVFQSHQAYGTLRFLGIHTYMTAGNGFKILT